MSLEAFARINKDTNEGEPIPMDLLEGLYNAIARDELKISGKQLRDVHHPFCQHERTAHPGRALSCHTHPRTSPRYLEPRSH